MDATMEQASGEAEMQGRIAGLLKNKQTNKQTNKQKVEHSFLTSSRIVPICFPNTTQNSGMNKGKGCAQLAPQKLSRHQKGSNGRSKTKRKGEDFPSVPLKYQGINLICISLKCDQM